MPFVLVRWGGGVGLGLGLGWRGEKECGIVSWGGGGGGDDCVASPKSVCRGGYEALVSQRKRMFFPAFVSFAAAAGDTEAGNGVCSPTIGFGEKKSRVYSRLQLCGIITDKKYIARRICCRPASNVAHSFR